jgi:nitrite reductase/ring-hydroxylating ferredoxin subunit
METENKFQKVLVGPLDKFESGNGKSVRIYNNVIAIVKTSSGEVFAIEDACPHIGAPLNNGIVEDSVLTCLWHGWSFDLKNGESTNCPGVCVKTFPVEIINNEVFVCIAPPEKLQIE